MTDRVKKDFEKWLLNKDCFYFPPEDGDASNLLHPDYFIQLPKSMQWGVKVDYYDSCGIYITDDATMEGNVFYEWEIYAGSTNYFECKESYLTRQEARKAALEKAMEIRDKQL